MVQFKQAETGEMESSEQNTAENEKVLYCVLCSKQEGQVVNNNKIILHELPEKDIDNSRRKIWMEKILQMKPEASITENTRLCNLHFENNICTKDSIPTKLLLEGSGNIQIKEEKLDENLNNTHESSFNNEDTEQPSCSTSANNSLVEDKPDTKMSLKEQLAQLPVCPSLSKEPVNVKLCSINTYITCALCGGYMYEASTITECMHTFCKTCIVRHIEKCLNCPTCDTQIHPTDPIVNIRHDSTIQDIVYRLLPDVAEEEQKREKEYYEEHEKLTGEKIIPKLTLPPPPPTTPPSREHDPFSFPVRKKKSRQPRSYKRQIKQEVKRYFNTNFVSLQLEYEGGETIEDSPLLQVELDKKFLRVTSKATAGNIVTFIRRKLQLEKFYHGYTKRWLKESQHVDTRKMNKCKFKCGLGKTSAEKLLSGWKFKLLVDLYYPTSTGHHLLPANNSLEKVREQYYDGEDILMELRYRITEDL